MTYLERQKVMHRELTYIGIRFGEQHILDLVECALHRKGWGYDRITELLKLVDELEEFYAPAFTVSEEADVFQERLDNELRDILKDRQPLVPFPVRYPEIKQLGYTKPHRGKKKK